MSAIVSIEDFADVKGSVIPEAFLASPEAIKIFENWFSKQSDPDVGISLFKKLEQLSLSPVILQAALLFLQNQATDILPNDPGNKTSSFSMGPLSDAVPLYQRMLKVQQFSVCPKNSEQVELTLRMMMAVLGDVQLLAAFLVLQLQQLEQLDSLSPRERNETSWKALNVLAPLAGRLGIFWIKSEMEDRAFRQLEYANYQNLKKKIARKRSDRSESVKIISKKLSQVLTKAGIAHDVSGRYKRFYSIFQKLEKVDHNFDRIQDLIAFRVLVNGIDECYAALSFIHENWTPIKNRFKDYIANPKSNGYQSLHTTVTDTQNGPLKYLRPIEIQIRTHNMHRLAEYGVAAHWLYKEKRQKPIVEKGKNIKVSMLKQSKTEWYNETVPLIDLFSENIYVMTPSKEIRELPQNATPVDFAYAIHTEIGNHMIGAKTNGNIARLDSYLQSGDTVEILTSSRQEPRKEWLEFVKTRHARNKIKHALQERNREVRRKEGWDNLEMEFKNHGLNLNRIVREGRMEKESRLRKNLEFEHILFSIGEGFIRSEEVRRWFADDHSSNRTSILESPEKPGALAKTQKKKISVPSSVSMIIVDGMDNVNTRIAQCCSPNQSHSIRGYLTKERVITIHKDSCYYLQKLALERMVKVHWGKDKRQN